MNRISVNGLENLKTWEGSIMRGGLHRPYDDYNGAEVKEGDDWRGYLTIGYGHLLTKSELNLEKIEINGKYLEYWNGLTEQQAIQLLDEDVDSAENEVNKVDVLLEQNQFDALVSFTFNVGNGAFRGSTLLKRLNKGLYEEIPNQLKRWNKSGGRINPGLINRRQHEADLWNSK